MQIEDSAPIYMIHESGRKFWEITVMGKSRTIRSGILRHGKECDIRKDTDDYLNQNAAEIRVNDLLLKKKAEGWRIVQALPEP